MISRQHSSSAGLIILAAAVVIAGIYWLDYLPAVRRQMETSMSDKISVIKAMAVPQMDRALKSKDDVLLLIQIETLARMDDIAAAYIIDHDGKILIHDKTAEWGQSYVDPLHRAAVAARKPLAQKSSPATWLYSLPLHSSATLCMAVSSQKADEAVAGLRQRAGFTAAALICIFAVAVLTIARRFSGGEPALAADTGTPQPGASADSERPAMLIASLVGHHPSAMIALDADNRVLAMHPRFAAAFSLPAASLTGKHILDVLPHPVIAGLMQKAADRRGTVVEDSFNGMRVYCVSAGNEMISAGTIFWLI